jgi:hypothetical protein
MTNLFESKTIVENLKGSVEQVNNFYQFMKQTSEAMTEKALSSHNEAAKNSIEWQKNFTAFGEEIFKKSMDQYFKTLEKFAAYWEN